MESVLLPCCPRCTRRDKVVDKQKMLTGAAVFAFILGFFLLVPWLFVPFIIFAAYKAKGSWQCRACWYSWR